MFDAIAPMPTPESPASGLWYFLPFGYLLTISIEAPVLLFGLSQKLSFKQRSMCGIWLTACTYPIVVLVLPILFQDQPRWLYLSAAETFAPAAECAIFWLAFRKTGLLDSDDCFTCFLAIVAANLGSFGIGEIFNYFGWLGLF